MKNKIIRVLHIARYNVWMSTGRSMLEMLGVLAIIGVLSISGLFGFRLAMTYHKANETLHDVMLRATNVPMIWEDYDTNLSYANMEFKFPELGSTNSIGYTTKTYGEPNNSPFVFRVEVSKVPVEVCERIIGMIPPDVDLIQVGIMTDKLRPALKEDCIIDGAMIFYFDDSWRNQPEHCENDNDCVNDYRCCSGVCQSSCSSIEEECTPPCSGCSVCTSGSCVDKSVPRMIGSCCDQQSGTCCPLTENCSCSITDPCCDKACGACEICENGECISLCTTDEICVNGVCEPKDPCKNVMCGTCEKCEKGTCVSDTTQPGCNECTPACDADNCEVCVDGICEMSCAENQICSGGVCTLPASCSAASSGSKSFAGSILVNVQTRHGIGSVDALTKSACCNVCDTTLDAGCDAFRLHQVKGFWNGSNVECCYEEDSVLTRVEGAPTTHSGYTCCSKASYGNNPTAFWDGGRPACCKGKIYTKSNGSLACCTEFIFSAERPFGEYADADCCNAWGNVVIEFAARPVCCPPGTLRLGGYAGRGCCPYDIFDACASRYEGTGGRCWFDLDKACFEGICVGESINPSDCPP